MLKGVTYTKAADRARGFCHEFLVMCPKCGGCARLWPRSDIDELESVEIRNVNPRRFKCLNCGLIRCWNEGGPVLLYALANWFRQLPLFLQTSCGEQTVWALNLQHLQTLREQVKALIADQTLRTELDEGPLKEWLETEYPEAIAEELDRLRKAKLDV